MKLTKDEIGRVLVKIIQEWKNQHAVVFSGDDTRLKSLLSLAFQTELEKEDTLISLWIFLLVSFDVKQNCRNIFLYHCLRCSDCIYKKN